MIEILIGLVPVLLSMALAIPAAGLIAARYKVEEFDHGMMLLAIAAGLAIGLFTSWLGVILIALFILWQQEEVDKNNDKVPPITFGL